MLLDETRLKALQQPSPPSHQEKDNRDFFVAETFVAETFDEVVARFFAFLASDEASFITGAALDVDGGFSI